MPSLHQQLDGFVADQKAMIVDSLAPSWLEYLTSFPCFPLLMSAGPPPSYPTPDFITFVPLLTQLPRRPRCILPSPSNKSSLPPCTFARSRECGGIKEEPHDTYKARKRKGIEKEVKRKEEKKNGDKIKASFRSSNLRLPHSRLVYVYGPAPHFLRSTHRYSLRV